MQFNSIVNFSVSLLFLFALENAGAQIFEGQERVIIDTTESTFGARSTYAVDLDGDGDNDVITASYDDNKIAWNENIGINSGIFAEQIIISTESVGATFVTAADLDGDGDFDIIATSEKDNKVSWFENLGVNSSKFSSENIIAFVSGASYADASDLNGDGDIDILVSASAGDRIVWFENFGLAEFSGYNLISNEIDAPPSVVATDLDGDGDKDILSGSTVDDKIVWFRNTGFNTGVFSKEIRVSTSRPDGVINISAADLDGDGDDDVISASYSDNTVAWYENTRLHSGLFSSTRIISNDVNKIRALDVEDFDGDGDYDILTASYLDGAMVWFENEGLHSAIFHQKHLITKDVRAFASLSSSDLDGDGDNDIISASYRSDNVSWYENQDINSGLFVSQSNITSCNTLISSISVVDMDGDQDLDVLSSSFMDGKIAWHENLGEGMFSRQKLISAYAHTAMQAYASDLDADGDMDVLACMLYDHKIVWYENLGLNSGVFAFEKLISNDCRGPEALLPVDLDRDGDLDLAVITTLDNDLVWFENLGGDSLRYSDKKLISNLVSDPFSILAADIDYDGDMDLISSSQNDNKIAWYKNLGGGMFSHQLVISDTVFGASSIDICDIDGDGLLDIACGAEHGNSISWFKNFGNGTFSSDRVISTNFIDVNSVHGEDLDKDGDLDIVAASRDGNTLSWFENEGINSGIFSDEKIIDSLYLDAHSVLTADFDQDGNIDLLASSFSGSKISWFENRPELVGIAKNRNESKLISWSNASEGLRLKSLINARSEVKIYNSQGQLVTTASIDANTSKTLNLTIGVYILKIASDKEFATVKVLVQ